MSQIQEKKVEKSKHERESKPADLARKKEELHEALDSLAEEIDQVLDDNDNNIETFLMEEIEEQAPTTCSCGFPLSECVAINGGGW